MGYGSKEEISEREWMPSVDAFFGGADGPSLNVMPPELVREQVSADSFKIPIGTQKRLDSINSLATEPGLRQNSCSLKSNCMDPPSGDEDHVEMVDRRAREIQELTKTCYQLTLMNDALRRNLEEMQSGDACVYDQSTTVSAESHNAREKKDTFDSLRQIWETQRDLLLERLKEKDTIISKQNEQLQMNAKTLKQLAAGIDGLEARFTREFESQRLKVEQFQTKIQQDAESALATTNEIDKSQDQMNGDLHRISNLVRTEMQSMAKALEESKTMLTQSDIEKQAALRKIDSTTRETERLRADVIKLSDSLRMEKAKNQKLLEQQKDASLATGMDKEYTSNNHASVEGSRVYASTNQNHSVDAVMKDKIELERKVLEMREKLVDLKEHSDELESQVLQQQAAFQESRNQIRELESLKKAKQEFEALLAVKQKSINTLKQTLTRLHSDKSQAAGATSCVDAKFLADMVELQKCCEDMESLLKNAQTERDICSKEMENLGDSVRFLTGEAKKHARVVEKAKKEIFELKKSLAVHKSEIATLQTNLRVENLKNSTHKRKQTRTSSSFDGDIMRELLKSKVDLAEMNEVVIRLRHEISTSKNKPQCKTKQGYHHFIRKAFTDVLTRTR